MVLIYTDKAGNKLYMANGKIFVLNAKGKLVNRSGVNLLIKRAKASGTLKRKGINISKVRKKRTRR